MTCLKRAPNSTPDAKTKGPTALRRGEAKLIRFGGLVPWRTASILANRAYMRLTSRVFAVGVSLRLPTRKQNGPVTLRVRAEAACPLGVLGDQNLRAAQHNERA